MKILIVLGFILQGCSWVSAPKVFSDRGSKLETIPISVLVNSQQRGLALTQTNVVSDDCWWLVRSSVDFDGVVTYEKLPSKSLPQNTELANYHVVIKCIERLAGQEGGSSMLVER